MYNHIKKLKLKLPRRHHCGKEKSLTNWQGRIKREVGHAFLMLREQVIAKEDLVVSLSGENEVELSFPWWSEELEILAKSPPIMTESLPAQHILNALKIIAQNKSYLQISLSEECAEVRS